MPMKLQENWQDWKEYLEEPHPEQMCGRQFKEQELSDPGKKIVTVICDSGLKYLNGDLYRY